MYKTKLIGREGEAEAARYLERKGYKIIGLNYSCRYGEIDVIAEKDGYAAIVEVKLRESADFAEAREFVTRSKQAKLRRAALHWLMHGAPAAFRRRRDIHGRPGAHNKPHRERI